MSAITLIDDDSYSASNLLNQSIDSSAPGRPKVEVQSAIIRAINPRIRINAFAARVENVPLARLDSSIILSCVDNRRARLVINRLAVRLGIPWLDAAVDTASLVRVNAYKPGASTPCMECALDDKYYAFPDQDYSCNTGNIEVPASGTPPELGSLAASLLVGELGKILNDDSDDASLIGAQFMLDTMTYEGHLCRYKRNEQCRSDHQLWRIEAITLPPAENTLADLFDAVDAGSDPAISLEGQVFTMYVDCIACGTRSNVGLSLFGRLPARARTCSCHGRMFAPGFFSFAAIRRSELSRTNLGLTLTALGIQSGDVISVTDGSGRARHIEIKEELSHHA